MPASLCFAIAGPVGPQEVAASLAALGPVAVDEARRVIRRHLDTFDWALWRSGGRLTVERDGNRRRLLWQPAGDGPPRAFRLTGEVRFAADLPAGTLRREVAAAAGRRALLPVGETAVQRTLVRVLDREGKTLVRVPIEDVQPMRGGAPAGPERRRLLVEPLTGYARAGHRAAEVLAATLVLAVDGGDELADAVVAAGRVPGDYSSKVAVRLTPGEPAERAVRRVLARLLRTLVANVEGTVQDLDTEFLHDLRVATRRTRTCLGQLEGVLPAERVAPFAGEFRWLGDATTPCRDLDVFLLDLDARRVSRQGAGGAALDPLVARLQADRETARAELAAALASERFHALVRRWGRLLGRRAPGGEDGSRPIGAVAGERVVRAYRRLARHGLALGPGAPVAAMHRLRIDGKKLRYLLEFFASLWDAEETAALVRELKLVQDALGDYHDAWLQRELVVGLGDEILAAGGRAAALLAMGELAADLERRQRARVETFFARFETFAGAPTRARLERLVGHRGGE